MQSLRIRAVGICLLVCSVFHLNLFQEAIAQQKRPNVIIIYTDDVGYGDLSVQGGRIPTPNIDKLARQGLRFTNAHAPASTCTPSRYALLTGEYPWRRAGTGIARGDASLIIPVAKETLPKMLRRAGYRTAAVGKWHLGLGSEEGPDWNGTVNPGPKEIGFDYSFIMPATGDRVPCVYMENGRVLNLSKDDPIRVDYQKNIGNEPTAISHPELLKLKWTHGHNNSVVNGVGRIGYMTGGKSALWRDEDLSDTLTLKAEQFILRSAGEPFFLYYATHDIHVPRVAHERYQGRSGFGPRGDVLLELDESVGRLMQVLEEKKILDRTIVIFTSDNGPVLDDGYVDQAVEKLADHNPWGGFRGGKYSAFEAGTRVPMIVSWPKQIKAGKTTDVLFSHVDMLASLSSFLGQSFDKASAKDSEDHWQALIGRSAKGRQAITVEALMGVVSYIRADGYKFIPASKGPAITNQWTNIETGFSPKEQLYHLHKDPGERSNLAASMPEKLEELKKELDLIRKK